MTRPSQAADPAKKANAAGEVEGQHDAGAHLKMEAVCERWILEEQRVDSLDIPAIYSDPHRFAPSS